MQETTVSLFTRLAFANRGGYCLTMSSFWETTKALASSSADATARASKRTKLRADISLKQRKIRQLKEEFGTKVYANF